MRVAVVAPSCALDPAIPPALLALAERNFAPRAPEIVFHPQCFLNDGHFAGPDAARIEALVEVANDEAVDAVWFARGGYGACRVAEAAIRRFGPAARSKRYLGYSDAGFLLAGLYARGIGSVAHGPMPADLKRSGGEAAVIRAIEWLTGGAAVDGEAVRSDVGIAPPLTGAAPRHVAFNLTVLSQLLGTQLQPDLTDHVLMIEEVSEYLYRIDRSLFHLTSNPEIRAVAGIRLGRMSDIPENDPDFGHDAEAIVRHWCAHAGIAFLGAADIGHDADNKVVAFG